MKKEVLAEMLNIISTKEPNLMSSPAYKEVQELMQKDPKEVSYAEKLKAQDRLEALCIVAGISYGRAIEKAFERAER